MSKTPDLDAAYGLDSPAANAKLYADWADSYDETFARDMAYRLPHLVASRFAQIGGQGPVLDLGAGTGLCGEALLRQGIGPTDGLDLSVEMLGVARSKGVYSNVVTGNLLGRLPFADSAYAGATSSGTFTHGHVGPEALDEVLRVVRPQGWVCLSVNAQHWSAKGFDAKLEKLGNLIAKVTVVEEPIYAAHTTGDHADDMARILGFQVA